MSELSASEIIDKVIYGKLGTTLEGGPLQHTMRAIAAELSAALLDALTEGGHLRDDALIDWKSVNAEAAHHVPESVVDEEGNSLPYFDRPVGFPEDDLTPTDKLYGSKTVDALRAEVARLTEERDLALAHDTQPYPTAWAYVQACAAAEIRRIRADELKIENARLRQVKITDDGAYEHVVELYHAEREDNERLRSALSDRTELLRQMAHWGGDTAEAAQSNRMLLALVDDCLAAALLDPGAEPQPKPTVPCDNCDGTGSLWGDTYTPTWRRMPTRSQKAVADPGAEP